jgi:hypothetical protein
MKIFECLMLGLLATSAMVPAINGMEAKEDASAHRVFLYDAPINSAEKELYFKFKSHFSSVCSEIGTKVQGLQEYLQWKQREGVLPTMHDGFQQALTEGRAQLHVALDKTPSLNRIRVMRLFEALAIREFRIYESLFAQADQLIAYLNTTTHVDGSYAYYNQRSITISKTNPQQQFDYLNIAHELRFESERLKALNPSLIETNQAYWSLLAYLTNSNDVQAANGNFFPVKQEVLDIFHAYATGLDPRSAEYKFLEAMLEEKNYTYDPPLHFDLEKALEIAAIMATGSPPHPYVPQNPIVIGKANILTAASVDGWNGPVVRYVPTEDVVDGLVQAVGKMAVAAPPPPPRVVETFSPQAKREFERVQTTLDTLHVAQEYAYNNASDKKYRGYSQDEQIMAYGNDSVISAALRVDVSQLLTDQLGLRGILVPGILTVEKAGVVRGYDAAASFLADWIRERITKDRLAVNVENVLAGLMYTMNKAKTYGRDDSDLFNTMWALRSVSMSYDTLTEAQVGKQAKDEILSLLSQSFGMIIEHNGRCATGAKGRNFLMQFNMLRFFKDSHPTTLS